MKLESLKGFRTFLFLAINALLASLQASGTLPWGEQVTALLFLVLNAILVMIRLDTNTPPGQKGPTPPEDEDPIIGA